MVGRKRQRRVKAGGGRLRAVEVLRVPSQAPFRWTRPLLAQLGKVTDRALAKKAGLHKKTVYEERHRRGIPPCQRLRPRVEWTDEMIAELGRDTDRNVAAVLDLHPRKRGRVTTLRRASLWHVGVHGGRSVSCCEGGRGWS